MSLKFFSIVAYIRGQIYSLLLVFHLRRAERKDMRQIGVNEFSTVPSGTVHDMQESIPILIRAAARCQRHFLLYNELFSTAADAWIFIWRHSKWQQTSN